MSNCCTIQNVKPSEPTKSRICPLCGERGKSVDIITLKSLLAPEAMKRLEPSTVYHFCRTADCPVVYYSAAGRVRLLPNLLPPNLLPPNLLPPNLLPPNLPSRFNDRDFFTKDELTVRVYQKETSDSTPVCYCFGFNRQQIFDEVARTGKSTAVQEITQYVKEGKCACELRNPQGSCCLGNVGQVVKHALQQEGALR